MRVFSDTSLTDGQIYYYKVHAHNTLGFGDYSTVASATAGDVPDQVTGQTATAAVDYDVDLAWSAAGANGNAITNYLIEHSADGSTNWTEKTTVGNVLTYHAEYDSADAGNTKYWRISAINGLGTGLESVNASVKIGDVPGQVSGFTATAQSATEIDLAWSVPADNGYSITYYKIEQSTTGVFGGEETVLTSTHTTTSYSDTGLTTSTDYYYRVSAENALGFGPVSATAQEKTFGVPSDIDDLVLTVISTSQIDLAWTEPALNGYSLVEYEIFRSEDNSSWTSLATQTGTSYSSTGLNINDLYYYKVTTKNGFGTSGDSNVENDATLPTPPAAVTLTVNSATQITVQWNTPTGDQQTSYKIEISTDGTNWSDEVASTGNTNTSYIDTGLTTLTTYYYKVSTINPSGTSVASGSSSAETWGVPDAPTNLTAVAVLNVDIDLDWDAPADTHGQPIIGYKIERGITNTSFSVHVADTGNDDTDYTDTVNLVAGTEYFYKVSAINSQGTGDPSGIVSATAADIPDAVTGLVITSAATDSVDLDWTAPSANGSPITGYKIEKSTDGTTYTVLVADTQSTAVTHTDDDGGNGLNVNTLYYYKVSAINAFGTGATDSANGATLPQAPSSLTLTVINDTSIKLDWANPSGDAESGFKIEISTDGTTWTDEVADTGTTSLTYTDTGLTPLTTYYYKVSTINISGTSVATSAQNEQTYGPTTVPLNFSATAILAVFHTNHTDTAIELDWDAPATNNGAAPSGYKIERSTSPSSGFAVLVADTGNTDTDYIDSDHALVTGTTYYYKVSAINTYGTSPTATANEIAKDSPDLVTGIVATSAATTQVELNWTAPNDNASPITGYHINWATDGLTWNVLEHDTGTSTSYTHTGLNANTKYWYTITAVNAFGHGAGTAQGTQAVTLPTAPATLTVSTQTVAQESNQGAIKLDWSAPYYGNSSIDITTSGFKIEISTDGTNWTTETTISFTPTNVNSYLSYVDDGIAQTTEFFYRVSTINVSGESVPGTAESTTTYGPTDKPESLTATSLIGAEIKLDWTECSPQFTCNNAPFPTGDANGYKIERSTDGTNYSVLVADTGSVAVTYTDGVSNVLTTGTTYYYQISSINDYGTSTPSTAANAIASDVPAQVTNLTADAVVGKVIDLVWTAPNNGGSAITGYLIERSTTSAVAGFTTLVADTQDPAVSYSDINLTVGTTYYYRVSAINLVGTGIASTAASDLAGDKPNQITVITATAVIGSEIDLAWTSPSDNSYAITSYAIEFSLDGSTNWQSAGSNTVNSFTHSSLTDGITYYYRVSATNSLGTSTFSGVVNALAGDKPDQVTGLTTTVLDDTQIRLNWTAPGDNAYAISGYKIEQSLDGSTNWVDVVSDTQSTTVLYTVTGLQPKTDYYYRVSAINSLGVGAESTTAVGTTFDVPDAITDLAGTASSVSIVLTWSAPDDNDSAIVGYRLQVEDFSTPGTWHTISSSIQTTTYTNSNIVDNLEYKFRVFTINGIGVSDASNTAAVWTLPTAPTGVTATAISGTEIGVAWTTSTGIAYKIEHSTDNVTFTTEADPATTPYSDTGLTIGTIHYYKVYAVNPSGTSPSSLVASTTTFDYPSQTLNLILTPTITNLLEITLNWTVPSDQGGTPVINYYVERSVDNITWSVLATVSSPTTSNVDSTLTIGTTYYYRVIAENSVGKDPANGYSAVVQYISPTLPGAASSLTAEPYGSQNSQIRVSWSAPSNSGSHPVIGYMVERNTDSAGWSTLIANTASAGTYITDSSLASGVDYAYRVYPITAAGTGTQASNIDQVTLVHAEVTIVTNVVGGNTIEIIPSVNVMAGSPGVELKLINLYMDGNFVSSHSGSSAILPPGVTTFSAMYAYPTAQAEFFVVVALTQHDGNNHQSTLTSTTDSATPSDPFTGDLDWHEFRVLVGSSVPSEQDYTQSNLELDIQPVGSDVIVKYTPQDPLLSPIILGFNNVQQALDEVIDTEAGSDYYVGVYIDPQFSQLYTTDPVTHVVSIDCNAFGNDFQALGLTCQEDDLPLGYKSDIAFRSLKDPTAPTQLGIEGMGDLFGMPMVMLFIIGIAAVFTGRSAQMGGIIIVALISVMIYLGYLPLMWESTTWVILIIIVVIGIFIGKRWS